MTKKIIKPPRLEKGGMIGIVTCSSHELSWFKDDFERGLNVLERMGFNIVISDNAFKKHEYMAGTEKERAADINTMFTDLEINTIICAGGSTNVNRLASHLDFEIIKKFQ